MRASEGETAAGPAARRTSRPRWLIAAGSSLGLFVACLAIAHVNYAFVVPPSRSAVFWLPSGLVFALFVRARRARWLWPGWLLATFAAELITVRLHGGSPALAVGWGAAAVTVELAAGLIAGRFVESSLAHRRTRDVPTLVVLTLVSVVPGALLAAITANRVIGVPIVAAAWSWAMSDAIGILLLAPVLLTFTADQRPSGGRLETLALLASMCAVAALIFFRPWPALVSLEYLLVAWAAIRFGPRGATFGMLLTNMVIVRLVVSEGGPAWIGSIDSAAELLNLQIVLANLCVLLLLLSATIEEQRQARAASEDALRIRDDFLAVASHELHTPIASMAVSIQGLLSDVARSPADSAKLLAILDRQLRRLTLLVGELLDTTRIRGGKINLQLEEVELDEVLKEAIARATPVAAQRGSTIQLDGQRHVSGRWDRLRLEQIFTNLLSNAMKFGAGKPIEVAIALHDPQTASVSIRDHGLGIAPDDVPRIFDQFVQGVPQLRYGGLGLGLYIVRSLVELHGGTVAVESTPGEGSTFTVRLPRGGRRPAAGEVTS